MTQFFGIIPPVVTPMKAEDQLDTQAVAGLVEHLLNGGVNGLFVLGTTGEGPSLTYQIRYEMVERTCEAAAGRVPVLVGITDTCLAESLELARHAKSCGATAVVAAAPFYFATDQAGLIRWFEQLADNSMLPLMLYNMPGCVGIDLELDTVVKLSQHPNIVGIKDSSGNLPEFRKLCQQFSDNPEFVVFMGPEELLADAVEAGAAGGVCGGANLLPEVYVQLFEAAIRGDSETIQHLKGIVDGVFRIIYRDPSGHMNLIPALKRAMEQCGLCSRQIAPPLMPITADHEAQILQGLESLAVPLRA